MVNITKFEVPVKKLHWHCDPKIFDFDCTKDLAPLKEFIGQDRAIGAIDFGLSMSHDGYNVYVAGLTGTGKTSAVKNHIDKLLKEKQASEQLKPPQDWCYLYNFADSDRPHTISLPQGKGKVFHNQVSGLLQRLKDDLAKAFSSEAYKAERKAIIEAAQEERQRLSSELKEEAQRQGFTVQVTPVGQALIPLVNSKPISEEEYIVLEEPARKELENRRNDLLKKLQATYEKVRDLEKKAEEKLRESDKSIAGFTVARLFDDLLQEYKDIELVNQFLLELQSHTLDNLDLF